MAEAHTIEIKPSLSSGAHNLHRTGIASMANKEDVLGIDTEPCDAKQPVEYADESGKRLIGELPESADSE